MSIHAWFYLGYAWKCLKNSPSPLRRTAETKVVLPYRTTTDNLVAFNVKRNKSDREGEVGKILNKDKPIHWKRLTVLSELIRILE